MLQSILAPKSRIGDLKEPDSGFPIGRIVFHGKRSTFVFKVSLNLKLKKQISSKFSL